MNIKEKLDYFSERAKYFLDTDFPQERIFIDNPSKKIEFSYLFDKKEDFFRYIEDDDILTEKDLLKNAFSIVYDLDVTLGKNNSPNFTFFKFFEEGIPSVNNIFLYDNVYDACLYLALCQYLHNTTRLKHQTLREFTYNNSLFKFNQKGSPNFCKLTPVANSDLLSFETTKLRKARNRILSQRKVYNDNTIWNAMRKDSEFEWALYYVLMDDNTDPTISDTFKRLGNLNNDINTLLKSDNDDITQAEIQAAYNKFNSKLKKIKYSNYLKTWAFILDRIYEEKNHYGINVYRLEKESRLFENISLVNKLLDCSTKEGEDDVLLKNFLLRNIWFPKVHKDFSTLTTTDIAFLQSIFSDLLASVVFKSRFIFDELVEKGKLGNDWETVFYEVINDMSKRVFYVPSDLDLTVRPGAEEKFIDLCASDVRYLLNMQFGNSFR